MGRVAQYRELAAFAQFASDLDEATRKQLERGQRVTELMKQKQYAPLSVAEMAVSLFAVNEGFIGLSYHLEGDLTLAPPETMDMPSDAA